MPRSGITPSYKVVDLLPGFRGFSILVSRVAVLFAATSTMNEGSYFPSSLTASLTVVLLKLVILTGTRGKLKVV